jgi:1-deoxy-D-xylulose-5-phosphate reductoisomerase
VTDDGPRKKITLLGSTGSIGRSALDVVRHYPDRFEISGLAAHANTDLLAQQVAEFKPRRVVVTDEEAGKRLQGEIAGVPVQVGADAVLDLAAQTADTVLCAMVGAVGLPPLLAAMEAGNRVAVANKEPFVMAGRYIMEKAARHDVEVLPVDSEHNAIFQCIHGHDPEDLRCIHLTASGGPFYGKPREELAQITPAQATRHPTWDMGAKISVDCATLMNKGLEIIEAMWLFGLPQDQIEVVIHPQSIIHSLVEFKDGNILAHLGVTDMKFPILFALTYPERVKSPMARLDLAAMGSLSFGTPDFEEFPCLRYARQAAAAGGTAPAILNGANEVAVNAFCAERLPFLGISDVVRRVMESVPASADYALDAVVDADTRARRKAERIIQERARA